MEISGMGCFVPSEIHLFHCIAESSNTQRSSEMMLTGRAVRYVSWIDVNYYSIVMMTMMIMCADGPNRSRSRCRALAIDARTRSPSPYTHDPSTPSQIYPTPHHTTDDSIKRRTQSTPWTHESTAHAVTSRRFEMHLASKRWWSVWYWSSLWGSYQLLSWSVKVSWLTLPFPSLSRCGSLDSFWPAAMNSLTWYCYFSLVVACCGTASPDDSATRFPTLILCNCWSRPAIFLHIFCCK